MKRKMIVILGPTATGKTRLAALLADKINGEIISADSRQIYRKMDIGTGKDIADYIVGGKVIKAHLIDIANAGEKYSLYRYYHDFQIAYEEIIAYNKVPIVCGGSGMYLEAALGLYNLNEVEESPDIRAQLVQKSDDELITMLKNISTVHNTTDTKDRIRLIRALEIAISNSKNGAKTLLPNDGIKDKYDNEPCTNLVYGVDLPREIVRERITKRLNNRLKEGLIEEVQTLLDQGIDYETLNYYGLEYRFVSLYLKGDLSYDEMVLKLNTAIHQFAKRQMTWFRRMEKRGIPIIWLPPEIETFISRIVDDLNFN